MKKNPAILLLVLLTIINIAALATFTYHRFYPRMPFPLTGQPAMNQPEPPKDFMQRELDLNPEQAKKFESHFEKFRTETRPIIDSLSNKRMELTQEMAGEPLDTAKLNQLVEEISALESRLQKRVISHMLETKAFLNPDQQKKFFLLFKEARDQARGPADPGRMDQNPRGPDINDHR